MSSARDNVQRNLRSEDLIISSYDYDASRNIYCLYMYIYRKHISLYTFAHIILGRTRRAFKKKNDSLFFSSFSGAPEFSFLRKCGFLKIERKHVFGGGGLLQVTHPSIALEIAEATLELCSKACSLGHLCLGNSSS